MVNTDVVKYDNVVVPVRKRGKDFAPGELDTTFW